MRRRRPAAISMPPTWTARRPSWRRPTWPAATATASSRSMRPAPGPTRWTAPTTSSWAAPTTPTASRWRRPTAPSQVITVTMHGTNDAAVITGVEHGGADRDQCGAVDRRRSQCHRRGQPGDLRGAEQRGRQQRLRQVLDRCGRHLDLHDEQRPRRVRGRPATTPTASRWRRPTARRRSSPSPCTAPTTRR